MEYAAIALAICGVAVGIIFRLRVLMPIIAAVFVASVIFSLSKHMGFLEAALTVFVAQAILQGGYFLGLLLRAAFALLSRRSVL